MKVIVDAFGGDNAPAEIVKGAVKAACNHGLEIILTGDKEKIDEVFKKENLSQNGIEIVHAPDIVSMHDEPTSAVKNKKESSMMKGFDLLSKGEGEAFVSAGSTGAMLAGATFIAKRIGGIKRAALAPVIPCVGGKFLLIDCGANAECRPEYLLQFGLMGKVYMEKVFGIKNPRIGLVNIGAEDTKGNDLQRQALALLRESGLNFVGNVEARDLPLGKVDVAVCDGFTGNIALKMYEGAAKFVSGEFKNVFYKSLKTKIGALLLKKDLTALTAKLDPNKVGGTAFLGIKKSVIKAHGNCKAEGICSAIKGAADFAKSGAIEVLSESFSREES